MLERKKIVRVLPALVAAMIGGCEDRKRVELYVESEGDFPFFNPDTLTCPWGAQVRLTFHHAGTVLTQSHNWVLVKPDAAEAVELAGIEAGEENGWLRKADPRVIAATPMIEKGATVSIEFTAPAPGEYPYICTTPGHAEDMHGILQVTRV